MTQPPDDLDDLAAFKSTIVAAAMGAVLSAVDNTEFLD